MLDQTVAARICAMSGAQPVAAVVSAEAVATAAAAGAAAAAAVIAIVRDAPGMFASVLHCVADAGVHCERHIFVW